ncbi:hypothetical protein [Erythrobacter sp. BLCC-B19]|uniref:hypothetical protein n=1 Tax=Erythrobacter sp. BLCC-B19 TaxID=3025315 RepID=UPI00235F7ABF|nr:hypothetical protein [Erythrobacter sp. BLCC-B19]WDA40592.1 hypothetical protein PS060_13615 [Erythrobacter sp. BLCC-B19]
MENHATGAPSTSGVQTIIAALEIQLAALDAMKSFVAAAHVDAAIQHLRLEQARLH